MPQLFLQLLLVPFETGAHVDQLAFQPCVFGEQVTGDRYEAHGRRGQAPLQEPASGARLAHACVADRRRPAAPRVAH
jgi:hypothetical protein